MDKVFSIAEAAQYLGVLPLTLRNWEKRGKISPFRTVGGHRRFKKSELDRIMNGAKPEYKLKEFIQCLKKVNTGRQDSRQLTVDAFMEAFREMSKAEK